MTDSQREDNLSQTFSRDLVSAREQSESSISGNFITNDNPFGIANGANVDANANANGNGYKVLDTMLDGHLRNPMNTLGYTPSALRNALSDGAVGASAGGGLQHYQ